MLAPPVHHTNQNLAKKIDIWNACCALLAGPSEGWKQGTIPGVDTVNNKTAAVHLTQTLGFPVSPHNVNSIRRAWGWTFRDKPIRAPRAPGARRKTRIERFERLEGAYTDLYEWATRQGFTGPNRIAG